jgi:hypothetical protein
MPYGHIERNFVRVGGAGTQFAINHTIGAGATNYCCFLTQDITTAGAAQGLPRAFVADADKTALIATMTDATAAGALQLDALVVRAYTGIDVGPVFNGNTRTVTLGTGMYTPNGHAAADDGIAEGNTIRAYRSLHRTVTFVGIAGNPSVDVIVTHHLNTANVVTFVSPSSDPVDVGDADVVKVFQQAVTADTVTLRMVKGAGGNFVGAPGNVTVIFDVMVLARVAVATLDAAQRPMTMRVHRATAGGNIGLPSDDYSGADLARARAVSFTTADSSYECLYQNVDAIAVAPGGLVLTHNFGTATKLPTGIIALFGFSATPGIAAPYILNRATSGTTMTLAAVGAGVPVANAYVLVTRPYSVFQNEITTN